MGKAGLKPCQQNWMCHLGMRFPWKCPKNSWTWLSMGWFSGDGGICSKVGLDDLRSFSNLNESVILQTWDSRDRASVRRDGKEGMETFPGNLPPQGVFYIPAAPSPSTGGTATAEFLPRFDPETTKPQLLSPPTTPSFHTTPKVFGPGPGGTWRAQEFTDPCSEAAQGLLMAMNSSRLLLRGEKWLWLPLLMSWSSSEEL